ncbi:hypothetical protein Syun_029806 [Stephania yunnanensis]|uniref:Uncharacterized protein n=1 Tax=Stephania yunnanensis TaxID=152371 RepID=A0AAP0E9M1_9MAGN
MGIYAARISRKLKAVVGHDLKGRLDEHVGDSVVTHLDRDGWAELCCGPKIERREERQNCGGLARGDNIHRRASPMRDWQCAVLLRRVELETQSSMPDEAERRSRVAVD